MQAMNKIAEELRFVRRYAKRPLMAPFLSRLTTLELLLVIADLDGNGEYGINDYIDRLETLQTTRLTIQNFIKDRVAEESLIVVEGKKRSRKTLKLSPDLRKELDEYLSDKK